MSELLSARLVFSSGKTRQTRRANLSIPESDRPGKDLEPDRVSRAERVNPAGDDMPDQGRLVHIQERFHAGPLPSPEQLALYDQVLPGTAEMIVHAVPTEAAHRRGLEQTEQRAVWAWRKRGQWMGYSITVLALVMGAILLAIGIKIGGYGSLILGAGLVAGNLLRR